MVKRIRNVSELEDSGFGQPWPRHGLRLLYWFAHQCVSGTCINDMILLCDPTRGDFGFHFFENRCIRPNVKLLPDVNFPYYVVGNMNSPGAEMLPDYVVEDHTHCREDNSNADRIIVCVHGDYRFGKVYVTTHKNLSNYDPRTTFHITRTFLWIIRSYQSIDFFLMDTGYVTSYQAETPNEPVPVWYYNPEILPWVTRPDHLVSPLPLQYYDSETYIDMETQSTLHSNEVQIQLENDTATQSHTQELPRRKGFIERFCTIL